MNPRDKTEKAWRLEIGYLCSRLGPRGEDPLECRVGFALLYNFLHARAPTPEMTKVMRHGARKTLERTIERSAEIHRDAHTALRLLDELEAFDE